VLSSVLAPALRVLLVLTVLCNGLDFKKLFSSSDCIHTLSLSILRISVSFCSVCGGPFQIENISSPQTFFDYNQIILSGQIAMYVQCKGTHIVLQSPKQVPNQVLERVTSKRKEWK
jgi:hypothetical protein